MKTLVIGATGLLGFEICRRLAESGGGVRGLVRATRIRKNARSSSGSAPSWWKAISRIPTRWLAPAPACRP